MKLDNQDFVKSMQYSGKQLRMQLINGEPWFALVDVCRILDLSNPSKVADRLDETDLCALTFSEGANNGHSEALFVNESGLYTAILRSNKPEAKLFKRWITSEVLPSIRRTGSYSINKSNFGRRNLEMAKYLLNEMEMQMDRIEALENEVGEVRARLVFIENKPGLNVTVTTAREFKTLKKDKLNEVGNEINGLVNKYFLTQGGDYQSAHIKAREAYKIETGKTYLGARQSTFESKIQFLNWLKSIK